MFVHRFLRKLRLLTLALPLGLSLMLSLPLTASAHALWAHQVFFKQKNLVSSENFSGSNPPNRKDPNLINSWGIVAVPDGPFWIADNNSDFATAYNGNGGRGSVHSPITIPQPKGSPPGTAANPTGIVFNRTDDFVIGNTGPAQLIFSSESGVIFAWNKNQGSTAVQVFPLNGQPTTAVYKGLALGHNSSGNFLFATNFHDGTIDVFDTHFNPQPASKFPFKDAGVPSIPSDFAPFGIRNIEGKLFVTFALQNAAKHDDVAGVGNGFVDEFDTTGKFVRRIASGGQLDSPWGLERAPDDFGQFSGALLVGNFGHVSDTEPSILAFDFKTHAFLGPLPDKNGNAIHIEGLWGLTLGDDVRNAKPDNLYFAAGPNDESEGLFGFLAPEEEN